MTTANLTMDIAGQRVNSRIAGEPCPVQFHDKQLGMVPGVVLDESFGGLGLMFTERVRLNVDENIQIAHNGVRAWAVVRHIAVSNVLTCRVGLEWKAAALSRRARAAMSRGALQPTNDSREAKRRARFLSLIPGGVNVLWKLFDAGNWPALVNSLERLRRESSACAIEELNVLAGEVESLIEGNANSQHIRPALDALVEYCLHLVEMAAIESIGR